ncbi:MAG: ankyrin repeat domain-containing protein [Alphaproteobacteria bacterium]|nr:ankyrin repeat domain-containing protein [Alphaproteobacteria bacterium]
MSDWDNTWGTIDWLSDDEIIMKKISDLIDQGAKMDTVDDDGNTLLMHAIKNENLNVFEQVLKCPQDLNVKNRWNRTALIRAASLNNTSMVRRLLQEKAEPNNQDKDGMTATICAAINDNPIMIYELKKHGANLDLKDNGGWSAMMWAISGEALNSVEKLMQYKVSMDGVEKWMRTAPISMPFRETVESFFENSKRKAALKKKMSQLNGGR